MQNKNISQQQWQIADEIGDDRPIGRVLSRREVLALLGTTGATLLLGGCVVPGLGGDQLLLTLAEDGGGYATTFDIALDLPDSEAGASDSF